MEVSMAIKPEVRKGVEAICAEYSKEPSPLMMILSKIQKEYGYIPLEVQEIVSAKTGIPVAEIYGVVTFYSFFSLEPKGKYVLGICLGTACYVKSSQQILDKFEQLLGIKAGQTTPDGLFTIEAIRCMGACALAPAMSVNGKVYPKVTPDEVNKIIAEYKAMEVNA
jgi:NADH-quinone oxidoreductase subunit E/NADP-reducing hydrogenase subunit HndA